MPLRAQKPNLGFPSSRQTFVVAKQTKGLYNTLGVKSLGFIPRLEARFLWLFEVFCISIQIVKFVLVPSSVPIECKKQRNLASKRGMKPRLFTPRVL